MDSQYVIYIDSKKILKVAMLLGLDQEEVIIQQQQHLQITCHGTIQVGRHELLLVHHFISTIKLFQSMGMFIRYLALFGDAS